MAKRNRWAEKKASSNGRQPVQPARGNPKVVAEIRRLLANKQFDDLAWWYRLGQRVLTWHPAEQRRYRESVIEKLMEQLPGGPSKCLRNTLYRARKLARQLSKREVAKLGKELQRDGSPLRLRHVFCLVMVEADSRKSLLQECLEKRWSARRLLTEIQKKRGYREHAGGTRKPWQVNPSPLPIAFREIQVLCRRWNTYSTAWLKQPGGSLYRKPKAEHRVHLSKELEKATNLLQEVADRVNGVQQQLAVLAQQITTK